MTVRVRRTRKGLVAALAVSIACVVAVPTAASADQASDGLWYFDLLHVQDAHDAGITGEGVTVAVIDSPINLAIPTLADAKITVTDAVPCFADGQPIAPVSEEFAATGFHGTNVVSFIVGSGAGYPGTPGVRGVAPGATLRYYVAGGPDVQCENADGTYKDDLPSEIGQAIDDGADIISMSIATDASDELVDVVARAERAGIILVFGLSNHKLGDGNWSPTANGVVSVQAADRNSQIETNELGAPT